MKILNMPTHSVLTLTYEKTFRHVYESVSPADSSQFVLDTPGRPDSRLRWRQSVGLILIITEMGGKVLFWVSTMKLSVWGIVLTSPVFTVSTPGG